MEASKPHVNPYLFERQLEAFQRFVEEQSGVAFVSFASNPYTEKQEGYKYEIHRAAREALAFQSWKRTDIGSGKIAEAVIRAIEIHGNNLVPWQGRYGEEARPHNLLYKIKDQQDQLRRIEDCLFRLYREEKDEDSFAELAGVFGKKYALLAYLFFLKDR